MSNWKNKSEENFKSADFLFGHSCFSSSIHCAYYGNIQYMLHVLFKHLKLTEEQIENDWNNTEIGYHVWLKNKITSELLKTGNFKIIPDFNNFFGQLKKMRIKSDYKNIMITDRKAKQTIFLSKKLIEILKEKF